MEEEENEHTSMQTLITEAGRTASHEVANFPAAAATAQLTRYEIGASDRQWITRSTALWTLMQLDERIKDALERCGIDHHRLEAMLVENGQFLVEEEFEPRKGSVAEGPLSKALSGEASTTISDGGQLDGLFAAAMRSYLETLPARRPIQFSWLTLPQQSCIPAVPKLAAGCQVALATSRSTLTLLYAQLPTS
jgi:hypothetical protein